MTRLTEAKGYRVIAAAATGAGVALALASCGSGGSAPSSSGTGCSAGAAAVSSLGTPAATVVATDQLLFMPATQAARVGQVIEWTAPGTSAHTVTFQASGASCLSDAQLSAGSTWEVKFSQPGTYAYKCTVHPGMNGTVTISP